MPYYVYEHPKTKEQKEVFQMMEEDHTYVDQDDIEWNRIFLSCNTAVDSRNIDPYSKRDFTRATNKKGTIGDLMDRSQELSQKRKDKDGIDRVKEGYYQDWSKKRGGKTHPEKAKQNLATAQKELTEKIKKSFG